MNKEHKWTPCGLNADWCVEAWHYGTNQPNSVDGDYYVCDDEDGIFSVNRYFPSKEEDCTKTIASFPTKVEAMDLVEKNLAFFGAGKKYLQAEYDAWLKNNVPASMLAELGRGICAWELMAYIGNEDPSDFGGWALTQAQYDWLADFCNRWDAIENS